MKKKTLFVSITALCAALMLAGCGNPLDDPSGAPPSGFTFVPVDGLEEGLNALEGMKAGDFNMEGVEFADDGDAGRDNGSFKIDGAELLLEEDLEGGPYYVKFNVAGFTHAEVIFVAYAGGPAGIEFTQDYRLMTGTAAFRGDIPIGTFTPEGGKPPYNYSLVTGTGGNDTGNSDFRGGADGVYAKPGLSAGTYNLYVRCTDSTGKHFQKAITVEAKAYAPPEFNEADFVSFKSGTVTGMFVYNSRVFVSDRVLNIGPFMLARYEVTQALWWDVYQWAISSDRGDNKYTFHAQSDTYKLPEAAPLAVDAGKPQAGIIWNNVVLWLNAFSEMRGLDPVYRGSSNTPLRSGTGDNEDYSKNGYRLPCDAEWEYAARGAVPTTEAGSPWMDLYVGRTAGTAEYRKYVNITGGSADLVGLYRPNIAGLYDMGGNVAEWCGDKFTNGSRYMGITMEDTNVWSPDTWSETSPCAYRVTRGRGYNYTEIKFERPIGDTDGYNSRSNFSSGKAKVTGFRVARTVVAGN